MFHGGSPTRCGGFCDGETRRRRATSTSCPSKSTLALGARCRLLPRSASNVRSVPRARTASPSSQRIARTRARFSSSTRTSTPPTSRRARCSCPRTSTSSSTKRTRSSTSSRRCSARRSTPRACARSRRCRATCSVTTIAKRPTSCSRVPIASRRCSLPSTNEASSRGSTRTVAPSSPAPTSSSRGSSSACATCRRIRPTPSSGRFARSGRRSISPTISRGRTT